MTRSILIHPALAAALLSSKVIAQSLVNSPALGGATIPAGTVLKIEADYKNQKLTSPTALAFDEQGRIYVTETHRFGAGIEDDRSHTYWYLDDLASQKTSDRLALHEKWKTKMPLARMTEKSELVRRFADTNADGILDEFKDFADGFNDVLDGTAAGVFAYEGAVYLACIPKLLMLHDADNDGRADTRKIIEEGFGVRVSLSGHDLNGFALGPDGRIYGTIGDRGFSFTTKGGIKLHYPNQGAVFRFEPDGTGFEVFHTGLRNPKEIAFDSFGFPVTVDNNSDQGDAARVVYVVEGGDSGWEMEHQTMHTFHREVGLQDRPPSRWMDEKMWHLANPDQPAYIVPPCAHLTSGPSGLTCHPGTGFLESEAGRFLVCDYRGGPANSGIWSFEMKPEGAGMKLTNSRKALWGVAVTDAEYSWDGRLFVTDFTGGWKSHNDGRLLSLDAGAQAWRAEAAKEAATLVREGFEQRDADDLAKLLHHPDARIRLRAQLALTRKPDALKHFSEATLSPDLIVRVHGIWGLGILARRGSSPLPNSEFGSIPASKLRTKAEAKLVSLITDADEQIRCQALRTLCDATTQAGHLQLGPLLADPSLRVRFFATILAGKRKMQGYFGPICDMIAENDNRDALLRHAGAFAIQNIPADSNAIRQLKRHPSPAVRLAAVIALRRLKNPDVSSFVKDSDPKVADEAIRAICDLDLTRCRPAVAALLDAPDQRKWSAIMLRRLLHNSFRIGDAANATRVLKFAANPQQPEPLRKEAFRLISIWTKPIPADQFTGHSYPHVERDPKILLPILSANLPALLDQKGFALTAALGLIDSYQVDIASLDDSALRKWVANSALPPEARAKALDLVIQRKPADLNEFLAKTISDTPDKVALTALGQLAKTTPDSAVALLAAALASNRPLLARESWKLLSSIPGDAVDILFAKHLEALATTNGISPHAVELMAAARQRSGKAVVTALAALEKSLASNKDPLAKWNISLEGGDPEAGKALFVSHPAGECMRCHRAGEGHTTGGDTAPNLAGVAKRHPDRRYFLESLLTPSAAIAPGFGVVSVDFKNGASLSGNLIDSTDDHIDLDSSGKPLRILRSDIASITSPLSPMPPMDGLLNPAELRDLVAWLATQNQEVAKTPATTTPIPFDPTTLAVPEKSTSTIDPAILKNGRAQFIVCGACHGQNGEGTATAPPLAGSEWVNGPAENLIRIQLRGLKGPISVKGQNYNFPVGMAPLAYQTDDQIAAVLTYARNSFGNSAPAITPEQVASFRSEVGKPQLNAAELVPPKGKVPGK
jgi:quinoprotein glucose dehydrogenase